MSLKTQEIIRRLDAWGHLHRPFGQLREVKTPLDQLDLKSAEVQDAVRSYQAMFAPSLDELVQKHHGRGLHVDGEAGPGTIELMEAPRCGQPDYSDTPKIAMAVGQGNWKRCHGVGEYHCAIVSINTAIPSFLQPHWDEIWGRVVESFAELGLLLVRKDGDAARNIDVSFVRPSGAWIGLAIVSNNSTCNSRIWAQFDNNYRPSNIVREWTTLLKHEFGHNCGLNHTPGGVMNAGIVPGLPVSWKTDVAYNQLVTRFGGSAVPRTPEGARQMVLAWKNPNGSYEWISDVPSTGVGFPV